VVPRRRGLGGEGSWIDHRSSPTRNLFLPDTQPQHFKKVAQLGSFLQRGGQKIGEKLERLGQKIKDFFQNLAPMEES
jgi:hypothetical protein